MVERVRGAKVLAADLRSGLIVRSLADLATAPRWVAWREEERNGKPTKIPYDPNTRRAAKIPTDPETWGTRAAAERRWHSLDHGQRGGVGVVLGDLGGVILMGVDLDGCVDSRREIADWAAGVLDRLQTYAEVSPSRTGIKCFFLAAPDCLELFKDNTTGNVRTRVAFAAGEHCELAIDRARFYAVTGKQVPDEPATLRTVATADVSWLINEAGPAFKRAHTQSQQATAPSSRDESGSGYGFRFLCDRKAAGDSFEAACAAIKADTGKAGEWARRSDERQLRRAYDRSLPALVLDTRAPLANAGKFVEQCYSADDGTELLCHYRGAFYAWTGTHWHEKLEENLEAELYEFLASSKVRSGAGSLVPFNPKKGHVSEVVHALSRSLLIDARVNMPSWLGKANAGRSADDLIACRNGIVNLVTRELTPHDPNFFTANCLPLDFDPDAPKPKRWFRFLRQLWPDFVDEEETLQEIFGYLLSRETRQQKVFLLVGPKRAGKGTITFLLIQLLGEQNVVTTSLKTMTGEFGLWPLIDKVLAVIPDARLSAKADQSSVAEKLLSISGGDMQSINRKYDTFWKGFLGVRFFITTNELPAIADASGTLPSRFVVLKLTESFFGREDVQLREKLVPELPGILNWALDGLDRLRQRGFFQLPPSSRALVREMEDLASPVAAFLREWGVVDAEIKASVTINEFYQAFRAWADDSGLHPPAITVFGKALRALVPALSKTGRGGNKWYVGVDLSEHGAEMWEQLKLERQERRRR